MSLSPMVQTFVLHFGEMGSRWGISRTVGQIYALLFVAPESLNADEIVEALGLSRSNVSMGLKELQSWGLVRLQHKPNDRRDYFTTPDDLWLIVRTLVEERKKREIDPTLSLLRDLLMENPTAPNDAHVQARLQELHNLIELLGGWYDDMKKLETERLVQLLKLGSKIQKIFDIKDKIFPFPSKKETA
jgi:DNA-binding transcriptional regulator GbsR (MarR family)